MTVFEKEMDKLNRMVANRQLLIVDAYILENQLYDYTIEQAELVTR